MRVVYWLPSDQAGDLVNKTGRAYERAHTGEGGGHSTAHKHALP